MSLSLEVLPPFSDVLTVMPKRFEDHRGYFSEVYNKSEWAKHGLNCEFIQDNQSLSVHKGTVRGLHFQTPPFAQSKLVRVLRGAVWDVVVDLRKNSPTFLQHAFVELSAESGMQLYIPSGFAHGFCSLTGNAEILYKVSAPYSKDHDAGILWNDPELGIPWPVDEQQAILSDKDKGLPLFDQIENFF